MSTNELLSIEDEITRDGSSPYPSVADRYHLYVAYACPFAQRTMIVRELKGLTDCISISFVDPVLEEGKPWSFEKSGDPIGFRNDLKEVYLHSHPEYKGRFTVPVFFDKVTKKVVSNNSGEIIKMLNNDFNEFCATESQKRLDLFPLSLRPEIDEMNNWIGPTINTGVYKVGTAKTQEAYNDAFHLLFKNLDEVEDLLRKRRYLTGSVLTLADVRLFTTLVRFDLVYFGLFRANLKRIQDYPDMYNYLKELYQMPAFKGTTNIGCIKEGYYLGFGRKLNPSKIVPLGPQIDLNVFHNRLRL